MPEDLKLNSGIMEIVEKAGACLALPGSKVYVDESRPDARENDTK